MNPQADVWLIHSRKVVLVTDTGGVPSAVITSSDGTIGGTFFPADAHVGSWELPMHGWGQAGIVAEQKARELGYAIECDAHW
jgi:hypothetical protein